MNRTILKGMLGIFFVIVFSYPAKAQEYYHVVCFGNLYGANAIIQGIYYLGPIFGIDNREVSFEGIIASNTFGNGKLIFQASYHRHPFEGEIISSHGRIPIRIWEDLNASDRSGTWKIQENYPHILKSQTYVGGMFCRAVG